jgi:hypothetical protein
LLQLPLAKMPPVGTDLQLPDDFDRSDDSVELLQQEFVMASTARTSVSPKVGRYKQNKFLDVLFLVMPFLFLAAVCLMLCLIKQLPPNPKDDGSQPHEPYSPRRFYPGLE